MGVVALLEVSWRWLFSRRQLYSAGGSTGLRDTSSNSTWKSTPDV